jgi:hypothetical protein
MQNLKEIREITVVLPPQSLVRRSCKKILTVPENIDLALAVEVGNHYNALLSVPWQRR